MPPFIRSSIGSPTQWILLVVLTSANHAWAANDGAQLEFSGQHSWASPTLEETATRFTTWLEAAGVDETQRLSVLNRLKLPGNISSDPDEQLRAVCTEISLVNPAAAPLIERCGQIIPNTNPVDLEWLANDEWDEWSSSNLRLLYGRWLTQHNFYDEALAQLKDVKSENVIAPATLLFCRGVAHHQLLNKAECLETVTRLLERRESLPRRYSTVAELMYADLKPLKTDSLDEIGRMMGNVERRLGFGRAGKRVRTEEDEILAKLDKMIEEAEKQQQQQQQQGADGASGSAPKAPMDKSAPAGGRGSGDVGDRDLGGGSPWGNLPAKDRQETLQDITKDLPAHYREVLEEYFRKLARERNEP